MAATGGGNLLSMSGEPAAVPSSREAEDYVLSCCFIDPADVIPACVDEKITSDSFHFPANQVLFEKLLDLYARKKPIDLAVVAEELKKTRQLDQIGGYPFLTEITGRAPTTAQARYFIGTVRDLQMRRELISAGLRLQEECRNGLTPDEIIADLRKRTDAIDSGRTSKLSDRLYNHAKQIEKPDPVFTLNGTTICTPGNLTTLLSQAKAGKTATIGAMLAASMTTPDQNRDTLGVEGPNYGKGALIHADTEQSPYDWQNSIRTSLKRAGRDKPPDWLMSLCLTGLPAKECRFMLQSAVRLALKRHGKIWCIIVDGTADLVIDPNDPKECFPLIAELHDLAIRHGCAIVNALHMNPGKDQEKARGHLGSQLERKAESNLMLHKDDGGVTELWGVKQRGKMIVRSDAQRFKWDDVLQMHVTVDEADSGAPKRAGKGGRNALVPFAMIKKIFPGADEKPVRLSQLARLAADLPTPNGEKITQRTLSRRIFEAIQDGFVVEIAGCYRLGPPAEWKARHSPPAQNDGAGSDAADLEPSF